LQNAIQFTPQYGDSFLEMMRYCFIVKDWDLLEKTKLQCVHSEPNYGVLWFHFKNSVLEGANDIWQNALEQVKKEVGDLRCFY
jgi:la-related protein 1